MPISVANPNGADYYRRGEPCTVLRGKVDNRSADYYRRSEPFIGLVITAVVRDMMKSGMVIPFQR